MKQATHTLTVPNPYFHSRHPRIPMKKINHSLTVLAAVLFIGASSLHATVLIDEKFGPAVPSGWSTTSASVTLSTSDTIGLDEYALVYSRTNSGGTDTAQGAWRTFASTTLANAGDVLTVSFSYKGLVYLNNNGNRVFFGLFNSLNGTAMDTADGYVGLLRADTRTDRSSPYSQFRGLDDGPSFQISGYTGTVYTPTVTGTQFYLNGVAADNTGNINDAFSFSYSITRALNGDLQLSQSFTNVTSPASFTSVTTIASADVLTYTFDSFTFGHNRVGPVSFAIDDLYVTVVPEPSTLALVLVGMSTIWFFRGRRRKA